MPITDISPHFHFSSPLSLFSLPTLPTASLAGLRWLSQFQRRFAFIFQIFAITISSPADISGFRAFIDSFRHFLSFLHILRHASPV
jgi:hypothetical protein